MGHGRPTKWRSETISYTTDRTSGSGISDSKPELKKAKTARQRYIPLFITNFYRKAHSTKLQHVHLFRCTNIYYLIIIHDRVLPLCVRKLCYDHGLCGTLITV